MKASYKEIKKEYEKIDYEIKRNKGNTTGGFFDKKTEKKYQRAIDAWERYFILNKSGSANIAYIQKITFDTKGDIRKSKDFINSLEAHKKYLNEILIKYKNIKEITEYSYIKLFMDVSKIVADQKYISAFKNAYDEYEKNKTNIKGNICNIFIMSHQIMISFLYFCMGSINHSTISSFSQIKKQNNSEIDKEFIGFLEETQKVYNSIICDLGFTAIEVAKNFEVMKNPSDEIKKAIKTQKESNERIAKAKESHDTVLMQNLYYELSEESYLSNEFDFSKGEEEALTVIAIVIASIAGIFGLIALIRRAIYICGTMKTDITNYIKIDVITVAMNIESLKEKLDNTSDPKERKRLQEIIDKQQKFVDKYAAKYQDVADDSNQSSYEATYTIEDEDERDSKTQDSSSSDDFDILI